MRKKLLAAVIAAAMLASYVVPVETDVVYAGEPEQGIEIKDVESAGNPEEVEQTENMENVDGLEFDEAAEDAGDEKNIAPGETLNDEAPASVAADEITYINPLYKDVITEEDLNPLPDNRIAAYAVSRYETDSNVIVRQMREAMASRTTMFTFHYQTAQSYDPSWVRNWFDQALEETDNPHEGDYLHWNIGGYRAGLVYGQEGNQWKYDYTMSVTYHSTAEQEKKFDTELTKLLNTLGVKGTALTDYEKVEKIYDYICKNVTYDYANLEDDSYMLKYTAYAALINKTAVCQGYATLMYRMQEEAGIDTRVITGLGDGGPHAWNLTQMGSKYYLSDSTWDSSITQGGYRYFLRGSTSFPNHIAESAFISSYPVSVSNYAITGITLNKTSLSLSKRGKETLTAAVQPASAAAGETVKWSSSDPEVVAVDNGVLTAKAFGTATVTAAAGGRRGNCTVTVKGCDGSHSWGATLEIGELPTCVKDGYRGIFCTACGELKEGSKEIIPAEGHKYQTSLTKATVTKNGSIESVCSVCGTHSSTVIYYPKTANLSGNRFNYDGSLKTPSVSVFGSDGKVISPSNYTVSYSEGRKDVGRYEVKISFRGNYSGTFLRTFDITPKGTGLSKLKNAKKGFTAKWKAQKKQTSGYEIQYSTDKKFGKSVKTKLVKKNKTVSAKIGKLKAKKKYYVRVRTYKTVKVNGSSQRIYSGWSKVRSVKTK